MTASQMSGAQSTPSAINAIQLASYLSSSPRIFDSESIYVRVYVVVCILPTCNHAVPSKFLVSVPDGSGCLRGAFALPVGRDRDAFGMDRMQARFDLDPRVVLRE